MTDTLQAFASDFPDVTESDWLSQVEKALKGGGIERITRATRDGLAIKPLYRESDYESAADLKGAPGAAPFLRGAKSEPDAFLPWDIRQSFSHPDPDVTNGELLRDLERGVSSLELVVDSSGETGIQLCTSNDFAAALSGVRAELAAIALDHQGAGSGASAAALLADWGTSQSDAAAQKFAFNIDPFGPLLRTGKVAGGLEASFAKTAALVPALAAKFPNATSLRVDARAIHEAGGTEAQELAALTAAAVDLLRNLETAGLDRAAAADQILFTLSVDANYGLNIAKLRGARRLWARVQDALGLPASAMKVQAVSSARMLTRFDPWVNMLRGTASCFAGAVGGADVVTIQAFNSALGRPEELGRRIARNTQIIAMEESGLGRISDPSGGAWFTETLSEDMAQAAWALFQEIEAEGGYAASLQAGTLQAKIADSRAKLEKDLGKRKVPITGVSEFPLLEEYDAPVAAPGPVSPKDGVSDSGLTALIPDFTSPAGADTTATALTAMRLADSYETLRIAALAYAEKKVHRPQIFLGTLGPLAEHTARLDFARNLFAAGGVEGIAPEGELASAADLASAFKASGCQIAVLCGADKRYETEAAGAAEALKGAGAITVWLAGKAEAAGVDRNIFMGCDVVHELTLAQANLGVSQ